MWIKIYRRKLLAVPVVFWYDPLRFLQHNRPCRHCQNKCRRKQDLVQYSLSLYWPLAKNYPGLTNSLQNRLSSGIRYSIFIEYLSIKLSLSIHSLIITCRPAHKASESEAFQAGNYFKIQIHRILFLRPSNNVKLFVCINSRNVGHTTGLLHQLAAYPCCGWFTAARYRQLGATIVLSSL